MTHKHFQIGRKVWYRSHPALFLCMLFCLSFSFMLLVGLGKVVAIEAASPHQPVSADRISTAAPSPSAIAAPAAPVPIAPAPTAPPAPSDGQSSERSNANPRLAPLQSHPLPSFLANWQDLDNQGDYFSEIKTTPLGYLVWTEFPVKVYIETPKMDPASGQIELRSQQWYDAVLQGTQEWQQYVPLMLIDDAELANITIWRIAPPLQVESRNFPGSTSPGGRVLRLPRVRAAETRYEFFLTAAAQSMSTIDPTIVPSPVVSATPTPSTSAASSIVPLAPASTLGNTSTVSPAIAATSSNTARLSHRFRILLSPSQAAIYTKATARHELGHALGIWGHSLSETDVMYFSQVRIPPAISRRDMNTLKRIYEQPTQLGWMLENPSNN